MRSASPWAERETVLLRASLQVGLLLQLPALRERVPLHLGRPGRMLLAQGMADPTRRHQNPAQERVTVYSDPEHVPDLPLVPVRVRPDIGDGRDRRVLPLQRRLQADVAVAPERQQVVDHAEIAVRLLGRLTSNALVDGGQVVEHLEWRRRLALEVGEHVAHMFRDRSTGSASRHAWPGR